MSQHTDQLASVIRRQVQDILSRGLNDPRVRGLISITDVQVSDDLAEARISVSVLPEEHSKLTLRGLESAASHIRSRVGRTASIRRLPRLIFRLDKTLKNQARVLDAIQRASRSGPDDDRTRPPDHADAASSRLSPTPRPRSEDCQQ